jgi:hypothetical protein
MESRISGIGKLVKKITLVLLLKTSKFVFMQYLYIHFTNCDNNILSNVLYKNEAV